MFVVVLFASAGWAANPQGQTEATDGRGEFPFKLFGGYLIVMEGRIGDHSKLKFALDTGVTHSVIDNKLVDRIPAPRRRLGKVLSFDKTINADWIEVPEIEFGPIRVTNFSMMIGDLRYFQSFATRVDSVIGLDLLRLSSFSIDYDAHRVKFGPLNTDSGVPMDVDGVCITVELMLGDSKARLMVDTGAQALVLYEDRVAGRLQQLKMEPETAGISLGGWVLSKRGFISNARLGRTRLDGTVFLVKAPPSSVLPGIDGYLGTAALKARRIDFDFKTKTLAWKK
jgi:predicted aspartyl protease